MRKRPAALVPFFFFALAGCSQQSADQFTSAINTALAGQPACVVVDPMSITSFPMKLVTEAQPTSSLCRTADPKVIRRLDALTQIGLLSASRVAGTKNINMPPVLGGGPCRLVTTTYDVTPEGRKSFSMILVKNLLGETRPNARFCYAKKQVAKVARWEDVMSNKDDVMVSYTYKLIDRKAWSREKVFLTSFPEAQQVIQGADSQVRHREVVRNQNGWAAVPSDMEDVQW